MQCRDRETRAEEVKWWKSGRQRKWACFVRALPHHHLDRTHARTLRCAALRSVAVRYRYRDLPATCYYYAIIARRAALASRAMRLVQLRKRQIRQLVLLPVACPVCPAGLDQAVIVIIIDD